MIIDMVWKNFESFMYNVGIKQKFHKETEDSYELLMIHHGIVFRTVILKETDESGLIDTVKLNYLRDSLEIIDYKDLVKETVVQGEEPSSFENDVWEEDESIDFPDV